MSKNALLLTTQKEAFDITVIQYPCMPTTVNLCSVGSKGGAGDTISSHTSSFNLPEGADSYFLSITAEYLEDWTCKGLYYDGELIPPTSLTTMPEYKKVLIDKKVNRGEVHTIITDNGSPANKHQFYIEAPGAESISATEIPFYANMRQTVMDYMLSITGISPLLEIEYKFPNIVYPGNTLYSATEWLDLDTNRPIDNCYPTRDYRLRAITKESDDALVGSYNISAEIDLSSAKIAKMRLYYEGIFKYSDNRIANRSVSFAYSVPGKSDPVFRRCGDYASLVFRLRSFNGCLYLSGIELSSDISHLISDDPNGCHKKIGMSLDFKSKRVVRSVINNDNPTIPAPGGNNYTYERNGSHLSFDNFFEFLIARENKDYSPDNYETLGDRVFDKCFVLCKLGHHKSFYHPANTNPGTGYFESPYYLSQEEQAQLEAEGKDPEAVLIDRIKKAVEDGSINKYYPVTSFKNFQTITIT